MVLTRSCKWTETSPLVSLSCVTCTVTTTTTMEVQRRRRWRCKETSPSVDDEVDRPEKMFCCRCESGLWECISATKHCRWPVGFIIQCQFCRPSEWSLGVLIRSIQAAATLKEQSLRRRRWPLHRTIVRSNGSYDSTIDWRIKHFHLEAFKASKWKLYSVAALY